MRAAQDAPGAPRITSLSPSRGAQGEEIGAFIIYGEDLEGATLIEFTPAEGITLSDLRGVGAKSVTATLRLSASAAPGNRAVRVVTPRGRSNQLTFEVVAATASVPFANFLPVTQGMEWHYRVTFPEKVELPYQPIAPQGCCGLICFMRDWEAGQIEFSVKVGPFLGALHGSPAWRADITETGQRFYMGIGVDPLALRLSRDGDATQLELYGYPGPLRFFRPLARVTAADLNEATTVTVPAGTFSNVIRTTVVLAGLGQPVRGTYTTEVSLAPDVGIIRAIMRSETGKTLYMQELTRFTRPAGSGPTGPFLISSLRAGPARNEYPHADLPIAVDFQDPSGTCHYVTAIWDIGDGSVRAVIGAKPPGIVPGQTSGTIRLTVTALNKQFAPAQTVPISLYLINGAGVRSNTLTGTFQTQ